MVGRSSRQTEKRALAVENFRRIVGDTTTRHSYLQRLESNWTKVGEVYINFKTRCPWGGGGTWEIRSKLPFSSVCVIRTGAVRMQRERAREKERKKERGEKESLTSHPSSNAHMSSQEITITMDVARVPSFTTVTPLIMVAVASASGAITKLRLNARWYRMVKSTGKRMQPENVGVARERGSIPAENRETRGTNECMTPAYCTRSNDIRDIIPAS